MFLGYPLAVLLGLLIASVVWTLADKQIRASVPNLSAVCLACGETKPWRSWLPLTWMTNDAACPQCGDSDASSRRRWEIGVGVYALAAWAFSSPWSFFLVLLGAAPLLLILCVDLKVQAVFLADCYVAIVLGVFLGLADSPAQAAGAVFGMGIAILVAAIFLVIARWIFRSLGVRTTPIGLTDLYVAAAVGAIVRFEGLLPALVAAVTAAAVYGVVVPVIWPAQRSRLAAFGPFLCVGGLVSLLL